MTRFLARSAGGMALLALALASEAVGAAEVKVLSAAVMRPVLSELAGEFERKTGHKLVVEYGTAGQVRGRIHKGERADVAIITTPHVESLIKSGKIVTNSGTVVAKVGVGVAVRAGAPKPDIGSTEAFKRAMTAAKSVVYDDPKTGATAGIHLEKVLLRLGIAGEVAAKSKLAPGNVDAMQMLAKGDGEIGVSFISIILATPGIELVGPLPAEQQYHAVLMAGIVSKGKQAAAKALIEFLTAPAAAQVVKAKGMDAG